MPRPRKCRKVCSLPDNVGFSPVSPAGGRSPVTLNVDEYEAIRLIDREGFSQEQCGEYMHIARATVQQIYTGARKKLADALVEGRSLWISGGDYRLCDGQERFCGCGGCRRHRRQPHDEEQGGSKMKTAIPLDENRQDVCIVLSRAPYFLFKEGDTETILENPAANAQSGAGVQAAQFLVDQGTTVLITPRCGQNAADVFTAADIKIFKSEMKTAAENLKAYDEGGLEPLTHFHSGYHGIK